MRRLLFVRVACVHLVVTCLYLVLSLGALVMNVALHVQELCPLFPPASLSASIFVNSVRSPCVILYELLQIAPGSTACVASAQVCFKTRGARVSYVVPPCA